MIDESTTDTAPPEPTFVERETTTRRTRVRVTALFAVAGLLCGMFTARLPAMVDQLDMSSARIGGVLFGWALAAVFAMQLLRPVMARVGSAVVLRVAAPASTVTLALVAFAPSYPAFLAAVATFGMTFGVLEIAVNAQGAALERAYGRPLLGGMHAAWGIGAVLGGLAAAGCSLAGVPYGWSVGAVAVLSLPLTLAITGRPAIAGGAPAAPSGGARRFPPAVYVLAAIAFAAFMVEGSVADWSGVLLRQGIGTSHPVAALGYPLFQCGLLTGRLATDRLRGRLGLRTVLGGGGLTTAVLFAAIGSTTAPGTVLACMYGTGVGISAVLPLAFSGAGVVEPHRSDPAVAQVGAIGYVGLLAGPVAVGTLAGLTDLRTGFVAVIVLLGAAIAAGALVLPRMAGDNDPVRVRPVGPDELEILRAIERAAGESFRGIGMPEIADDEPLPVEELATYQRDGRAWVTVDPADRPTAYLITDLIDGNVHVEQVSVHPDYARQGLGRALLEHAADKARAALTLTTFAEVPWNAPYYERCGFRILPESEWTSGLRAIRRREAAHGLDRWPRVCMRRP